MKYYILRKIHNLDAEDGKYNKKLDIDDIQSEYREIDISAGEKS